MGQRPNVNALSQGLWDSFALALGFQGVVD
jgi:hypothetical protein